MRDVHSLQAFFFALVVKALHFSVQPVAYLLQHDIGICVFTGMLSGFSNIGKDFVYIGQIEVTAQCQVLGTPVVAAEKWMNIRDTAFSGGRITQVSHVKFSGKWQALLCKFCIVQLFFR